MPKNVNPNKYKKEVKTFNIELGNDVWCQEIYPTGIDDLVQIYLINDKNKQIFVVTWNLMLNREHSNF